MHPFAALRVRDICDRAGFSTGAFYLHWGSVEDYFDALSDYFLAQDSEMFGADFATTARIARETPIADPLAALRRVASADFEALITNEQWDAVELFLMTWGRTRFRKKALRGYHEVDRITAETCGVLLERIGRQPREPFTLQQVASLLQALAEGLGLRHRVDPETLDATHRSQRDARLPAMGIACLITVMPRPIGRRPRHV